MDTQAIPVAVALLLKDGAVLMGERRAHKVYPLHWEFPGGKVESGETYEEAVRREIAEELGLEVISAEEWFAELATYSNGMTYDIHYFLVREFRGTMQNHEFNRVLWVTNETLPTLQHLTGNERVLRKLETQGIPS